MHNSHLEKRFEALWLRHWPSLDLHKEHRFSKLRKYRLDFAHLPTKTGIEINGGIWVKSGHSSGTGLQRDYEKNNRAIFSGWNIITLSDEMITTQWVLEIGCYISNKVSY